VITQTGGRARQKNTEAEEEETGARRETSNKVLNEKLGHGRTKITRGTIESVWEMSRKGTITPVFLVGGV